MNFLNGFFGGGKARGPVSTNKEKIDEILTRAVEDVFVVEKLREMLLSGKRLRIKLGIDPTSASIHIGRAVVLWKLRAFQELGHQIVLIVGDFTAQIGDASDKLSKRPMLTREAVAENMRAYKEQIAKVLDISQTEFVYNSVWLGKLGFQEVCTLAESFSVQQMLARRNFADRMEKGEEISLREFMYPIMQGYDSVAVKADVELGGFDQLFNLKAGRAIQKHYGMPEQQVLTVQMLEGTDGRKMSSSWGNVITINAEAFDMFGKVMSVKDELIPAYFLLATHIPQLEVEAIKKTLEAGSINPRDLKIRLAKEIVALYHGADAAKRAEENFIKTFSQGGIPESIPTARAAAGEKIVDILVREKIVDSKSEFRRLLDEGAIKDAVTGDVVMSPDAQVTKAVTLKVGKKRFLQVTM